MQRVAWSFVGMEYYALLLNRTFVLSLDGAHLRGVRCRGLTSTAGGRDALARFINQRLAVQGDLDDPSSYIGERGRAHRADFRIPLCAITTVEHEPRPKWGMGYYPHDGRVLVRTAARTREFMVLGRQSGQAIADYLRRAAEQARAEDRAR
jgi:hypothetical protein